MKTLQLLTLFLGVTIFWTTGLAQELKQDTKNGTTKQAVDANNSAESRFSPKTYQNTDWTRKSNEPQYERGKIRTH